MTDFDKDIRLEQRVSAFRSLQNSFMVWMNFTLFIGLMITLVGSISVMDRRSSAEASFEAELRELHSRALTVLLNGADADYTGDAPGPRFSFGESSTTIQNNLEIVRSAILNGGRISNTESSVTLLEAYLLGPVSFSNTTLLFLILVSASTIGAQISEVRKCRRERRPAILDQGGVVIGAFAGLVIFLGVKGAIYAFLELEADVTTLVNPYTSAFLAILSGSFSEKFYNALETLAENAKSRLDPKQGA